MLVLKRSLLVSLLVFVFFAGLLVPGTVNAATAKASTTKSATAATTQYDSTSQSVTQGYNTDEDLQQGMLVTPKKNDAKKVEAITSQTVGDILGVVVNANDATVALSSDANTKQVFVASFGHYDVLVSNQNGPIKVGDYITASALAGIGMKAGEDQSAVVGRASDNFTGTNNVISTVKLKTSSGGTISASIGRIPVDISISHNPLQQTGAKGVPGFLQRAASSIANKKEVGVTRIYISLVILAVTSMIVGAILYSGIRGGLIAIGRNPFAKKTIVGGIVRVVLSGVIIFVIGLFGVYLILRL